ncbi:hypothetical protein [Zoogloea sp.]|uniref:hypothetical protein n=1 Tax=Zoogloea sp. TaxID=49181 RepID=UPI00262D348C|nr:hypothetical protein [Zoogloea sp.]
MEYRETLRFKRGSPRHVQPATEAIVQEMQLKAVSAPTLRADEAFRAQREVEAIAVNAIARKLNERPRKTLNYETPAQRFQQSVTSTG